MIEDIICPRCNSDHVRRSLKTATERFFFNGRNYYRCRACGVRFKQKPTSKNKNQLPQSDQTISSAIKADKKPWYNFVKK